MKKIITLATIVAAFSTSAFAQVSNFTGYSAGVNLDHISVTTELSSFNNGAIDGIGQQSVGASLQASYGVELSSNSVLSIGATYSLVNAKAGELRSADGTITFKVKNQYSLYLEPGYLISEKTLAYGKVSYEAAKGTADVTGDVGGSENVQGMGYGFGIRTMIDKNLLLQAEVKSIKYGSKSFGDDTSIFKSTATVGSIGLNYKF